MADLYKKFQQDSLFRIFKNGGNKGFRDIIEDPDKLKQNVLAHRDFKTKNKIEDIDNFIDDISKFVDKRDKRILDRVKLLDDFSKDPNEENYLLLDKFLKKTSLNRFDFKKGMIPSETKTKPKEKKIEIVVEADGSLSKEQTQEEKELEEKTLKQLKEIQEGIERREEEMLKLEKKQDEEDKRKKELEKMLDEEVEKKFNEKFEEKTKERLEREQMSKQEEEEKVREKLLEEAEKELGDIVDNLDRNRQENAEIRKEQTLKKDGRIKKVEERKNNKEFEELTNREAQIQKDIKKLSKSVADEAIKKAMESMESIKEEDEKEEDDEDFLVLRRKQKEKIREEESEKKDEDDEDDDEVEVSDLPDDEEELRTPRGEPEEMKEEEKEEEKPEGVHMMPDGTIMSGETHSSSSKPVDPMTISKPAMEEMKDKQEQGIMDIPTGLTPLPEDRRSAEGKSVAQLKSDINYFFKNYGEILKPQIKQYKILKKTKENLKNFHRRIVGILIPDMKEASDGKKIGIILDAEQYLNNKINEILLQKITEGLRPEDLLVDVTKPDDSQKRTGKQYGSYIVKGDRAGKLASERAPVFRAIPSSNEDKMEDPYKYEEKSNDIQMLRSQRWSKVNAAKKKVRIDPFIRYSKPSQIEIRL